MTEDSVSMNKTVGVQLRPGGRVQAFDCGHFVLRKGDMVIVVTEEGPSLGKVCVESLSPPECTCATPQSKVFRLATSDELHRYEEVRLLEGDIQDYCLGRIKARSIPMRLVGVDCRFDGSKVVVFFTAEGRVDFRELVKDLVSRFRTRIEMRQIGVRHQARMVGGLGTCGRPLCCATFLNTFATVTIKMAKEQNVSLNPTKISGMCGRLMCCLTYEHGTYDEAKKRLPKMGKRVMTRHGQGKVIRQNVIKNTVTIALETGTEMEISPSEIEEREPHPPPASRAPAAKE